MLKLIEHSQGDVFTSERLWEYVTVDDQGRNCIDLNGRNVREDWKLREIPGNVYSLQDLAVLEISNHHIRDIPKRVATMTTITRLNLASNHLKIIPNSLFCLNNLQDLDVSRNLLQEIGEEISRLTSLKKLVISHNRFRKTPVAIFGVKCLEELRARAIDIHDVKDIENITELENLKVLDISENEFNIFPPALLKMNSLETCIVNDCGIKELPPEIGNLHHLRTLSLQNNYLLELPTEITKLRGIVALHFENNDLFALPSEFHRLSGLRVLSLAENKLTDLDHFKIYEMESIEYLDISENRLKYLPLQFHQMKNLAKMKWFGNPLVMPPAQICADGIDAIFQYLEDAQRSTRRHKLVLLGDTMMGKTSVTNTLLTGEARLARKQDRTRVLDQHMWNTKEGVYIHIYDYGGHDIYAVTHPFFLNSKATVLLVFNLNEPVSNIVEKRLEHWFCRLDSFLPTSRVVLVATHTDLLPNEEEVKKRKQEVEALLNQRCLNKITQLQNHIDELEERSKNEKDNAALAAYKRRKVDLIQRISTLKNQKCQVFCISSKTMYGIDELHKEILRFSQLDGIVLPSSWFSISCAITQVSYGPTPFIPWTKVREINQRTKSCIASLFSGIQNAMGLTEKKLRTVMTALHQIGDVIWFREHPQLSEVIFHKTQLLVDFMKCLLHHDHLSLRLKDTKTFTDAMDPAALRKAVEDFQMRGYMSLPFLKCMWSDYSLNDGAMETLVQLLVTFDMCYEVKEISDSQNNEVTEISDTHEVGLYFPKLYHHTKPAFVQEKWSKHPPAGFIQLTKRFQFSIGAPSTFFEMALVHLFKCLPRKDFSKWHDWKGGAYVETQYSGLKKPSSLVWNVDAKIQAYAVTNGNGNHVGSGNSSQTNNGDIAMNTLNGDQNFPVSILLERIELDEHIEHISLSVRTQASNLVNGWKTMVLLQEDFEELLQTYWPGVYCEEYLQCPHCLSSGTLSASQEPHLFPGELMKQTCPSGKTTVLCPNAVGDGQIPAALVYPVTDENRLHLEALNDYLATC